MADNVISIEGLTRPDEIRAGIVEKLEEWLELAKAGQFKALSLCAIDIENSSLVAVCANDSMHALLGAIVHMQYDLIQSYDDD